MKKLLLGLVACVMTMSAMAKNGPGEDQIIMIDFVVMNEGYDIDERNKYDEKVGKVAEKYNMKVIQSYQLVKEMAGQLKGAVKLNIWQLPSKEVLSKLGSDPKYQELVSWRNEIHDMNAVTLYFGEELTNQGQLTAENIFVDLVVMNQGYGHEARDDYESRIVPLAGKYGMQLKNVFKINEYKMGKGPKDAIRLNIWEVDDPAKMKELGQDPIYQKEVPNRNKIHNMEVLTLYMAKSL